LNSVQRHFVGIDFQGQKSQEPNSSIGSEPNKKKALAGYLNMLRVKHCVESMTMKDGIMMRHQTASRSNASLAAKSTYRQALIFYHCLNISSVTGFVT
jgi:hypothetical protein